MKLKKTLWWIIAFNLFYALIFLIYYISTKNYEFILYLGVFSILFTLGILTLYKTNFSNSILWLLSLGGLLHLLGGAMKINGEVLYNFVIINLIGKGDYVILKYDQIMHLFGMFVIAISAYHILNNYLKNSSLIYLCVFFIGVGWGSLVETIEFLNKVLFQDTGVGGYNNNMIDLIFNTLGSLVAVIYLRCKNGKP